MNASETIFTNSPDESIFHSGYLERRSKWFKMWTVRWFVLHGRILNGYTDKTLTKQRGRLVLSPSTAIEALPHEGSRKFIFTIREESGRSWILSAEDFSSQESWMIQVIQASRGAFASHENFETGESWVTGENKAQVHGSISQGISIGSGIQVGNHEENNDEEEEDSFFHVEKSPDSKVAAPTSDSSSSPYGIVIKSPPVSSKRKSSLRRLTT